MKIELLKSLYFNKILREVATKTCLNRFPLKIYIDNIAVYTLKLYCVDVRFKVMKVEGRELLYNV